MGMILVYLIVRELKGISFDKLFIYCDLLTRSDGYKLYKNHCHLKNKFMNSFSQRSINDYWNSLPRDIIESPDLTTCKSKLDLQWQDLHFRFQIFDLIGFLKDFVIFL